MKTTIDVSHKVGSVIEGVSRVYTVVGYEYIESRGSRVCLAYVNNGTVEWLWVFPFEVKMLEQKEPTLQPFNPTPHDRSKSHSRKRR